MSTFEWLDVFHDLFRRSLVSKRGIDTLREHLLQEGHTGIPTRNDRIFDELQQNNVLTPNGDRSIWKVEITGEDWSHTLTCLCFPASRIWPDPDSRPDVFNGSITPVVSGTDDESNTDTTPQSVTENIATIPREQPTPDKQDSVTGNFDPVAFFSNSQTEETPHNAESIDTELIEDMNDPGQLFQAWLQDGLRKDKFETNSVNARIHRVEEGLLLVSPGIFKDYDKEDWQRVQKRFQKLKLHRKTPQGTNIYTYQVTGKRNKSRIKGFLIEEPEAVFNGISLPTPNPHLKLAEEL